MATDMKTPLKQIIFNLTSGNKLAMSFTAVKILLEQGIKLRDKHSELLDFQDDQMTHVRVFKMGKSIRRKLENSRSTNAPH